MSPQASDFDAAQRDGAKAELATQAKTCVQSTLQAANRTWADAPPQERRAAQLRCEGQVRQAFEAAGGHEGEFEIVARAAAGAALAAKSVSCVEDELAAVGTWADASEQERSDARQVCEAEVKQAFELAGGGGDEGRFREARRDAARAELVDKSTASRTGGVEGGGASKQESESVREGERGQIGKRAEGREGERRGGGGRGSAPPTPPF